MALNRKQRDCLKVLNYSLFNTELSSRLSGSTQLVLPDEDELQRMFSRINFQYFSGRLPEVKIEWSNRLRMAGKYLINDRIIRLGRRYHEHFPQEVEDTLKHEMIHILYPDHGRLFRAEAVRIGASRYARDYPGARMSYKYIYACPACGQKYYRRKRYRMVSCGYCSNNGYDERFKLRLIWSVRSKGEKR